MVRDILELGGSLGFLDELYERYQESGDVDASWKGLLGERPTNGHNGHNGHGANGTAVAYGANGNGHAAMLPTFVRPGAVTMSPVLAQPSVWPLVNAYRGRGHFAAQLDPLGLLETARVVELDPQTWGFTNPQLVIEPTGVHGLPHATPAELVAYLQLGSDAFRTVVDEETIELIAWQSTRADEAPTTRRARMPRVIFVR